MKLNDLKLKSAVELRELLGQTSKRIAEDAFYHTRARSKNVKEIRELRRQRARILTLLRGKTS